jgi:hypothetical protein
MTSLRGQTARITFHLPLITHEFLFLVFDSHAAVATALRSVLVGLRLSIIPIVSEFRWWICAELFRSLVRIRFIVTFPPEYPDVCPTISLEDLDDEGPLTEEEEEKVLKGLEEVVR